MHRIRCSNCGEILKFSPEAAGRTGRCAKCRQAVRIPENLGGIPTLDSAENPTPQTSLASVQTVSTSSFRSGAATSHKNGSGLISVIANHVAAFRAKRGAAELEGRWQTELVDLGLDVIGDDQQHAFDDARQRFHNYEAAIEKCHQKLGSFERMKDATDAANQVRSELMMHEGDRQALLAETGLQAYQTGALPPDRRERLDDLNQALNRAQAESAGKPPPLRSHNWTRVATVVVTILLALGLIKAFDYTLGSSVIVDVRDEAQLQLAIAKVVTGNRRTAPNGETTEELTGHGTGFFVTSDGYLLTNRHVVETTWNRMKAPELERKRREELTIIEPTVWVLVGRKKYVSEVIHVSDDYDMSLLKVDRPDRQHFKLSGADHVSRETTVRALGFPGAAEIELNQEEALEKIIKGAKARKIESLFKPSDFEFTTTKGTVSKMREDSDETMWIQTDCAISGGNSGGPLVTDDGVVVGINTLGHRHESAYQWSLATFQLKDELRPHISRIKWK